MNGLLVDIVYFMYVISFIFGVYLGIKGFFRFRELWDIDKSTWLKSDVFWRFVSLVLGTIAAFIYFGGMVDYAVNDSEAAFINTFSAILVLAPIALGLSAFAVFLKWWDVRTTA